VTPYRIKENLHGMFFAVYWFQHIFSLSPISVVPLPQESFERLEQAATSHEPHRTGNPSKRWGLDFDIFDD
jgi:hypothetical protein